MAYASRKDVVVARNVSKAEEFREAFEEETEETGVGVIDPCDPIPDAVQHVGALQIPAMADRLLPATEDATLTAPTVKATMKDHYNKVDILQVLEFVAGIAPDFELLGKFRCYYQMTKLVLRRSNSRGRRGGTLKLPTVRVDDGFGRIVGVDASGQLVVVHRFTKHVVRIPRGKLALMCR